MLQGFAGWYMVKSGLVSNPHVSHFRLAIHFFLMLLIMGLILRALWKMERKTKELEDRRWKMKVEEGGWLKVRTPLIILTTLVLLQLLYGAFTAGLKAGYGFNTWPMMDGEFFPASQAHGSSVIDFLFYNHAVVQFIHRWLGASVVLLSFALSFRFIKFSALRKPFLIFMGLLVLQALLGIMTLLTHVRIELAVLHQLNGVLVFISLIRLNFKVFSPRIYTAFQKIPVEAEVSVA
jgi:cytochrome c oxidase assembly protein subunit 15